MEKLPSDLALKAYTSYSVYMLSGSELNVLQLCVLSCMSLESIYMPEILHRLKDGQSLRQVARITGISQAKVRTIGRKAGILC